MTGNCIREAVTVSSGNMELVPSNENRETFLSIQRKEIRRLLPLMLEEPLGNGEAAFNGKSDSSEFRGSVSPVSSKSSHTSLFYLSASHSFPMNAITLVIDTLQGWEFNLHSN